MDKIALSALMRSIEKWEGIVAGTEVDKGGNNCALCMQFDDCTGCPVFEHTDREDCENTPWYAWYASHDRDGQKMLTEGLPANTEHRKELARAELDFLKSLLPEPSTEGPNV